MIVIVFQGMKEMKSCKMIVGVIFVELKFSQFVDEYGLKTTYRH